MKSESRQLKSSYLDQLEREIQHLICIGSYSPSSEVSKIMQTVNDARNDCPKWPSIEWFLSKTKPMISSSDMYLLEATLIDHLDPTGLRIRIVVLRDLLSSLVTDRSYSIIQPIFADLDDANLTLESLRSEARELLSRVYRRYETVPAVEHIRIGQVKRILLVSVLILGCAYLIYSFGVLPNTKLVLSMGAAGAIGAAISTIQRLYALNPKDEPFITCLSLQSGQFSLALSPLIGFVFAGVMFLVIQSGLVSGLIFPDRKCWATLSCFGRFGPEFAQIVFWGFAAGWAERLVPDVLNRLSSAAPEGVRTHNRVSDP